nr:MAG TPA: Scaffold protein [Microviridae sp.]
MEEINFKCLKRRKGKAQSFDKSKISFIRAGQKINVYDLIQAAGENTDLYKIMDTYGVTSQEAIARAQMDTGQLYQDLTSLNSPNDLRDAMQKIENAETMWRNLPLEVRKEFNFSKGEFLNRGEKWLKQKIDEKKAKEQPIIEKKPTTEKVKEQNNG